MDISTILKKLDLSYAKIALMAVFNREGLYEYALGKANTAVNILLEANAEQVTAVREKLSVINQKMMEYAEYIPRPWFDYAEAVNAALMEIYVATEDLVLTGEEGLAIVNRFRAAYSAFMAD